MTRGGRSLWLGCIMEFLGCIFSFVLSWFLSCGFGGRFFVVFSASGMYVFVSLSFLLSGAAGVLETYCTSVLGWKIM